MRRPRLLPALVGLALCGALSWQGVGGAFADPTPVVSASEEITSFSATLVSALQTSGNREAIIGKAVDRTFNLGVMAQFILGEAWARMAPDERTRVQAALREYAIARFSHAFGAYSGQIFITDPVVRSRGPDTLVRTTIQSPHEETDRVDYRMRQYGHDWKVIDIYYNGVSDLTTQRADLAATVTSGGVQALIARINEATQKLR